MSEAGRTPILQRKARSGREEHQARTMTPARALRLAFARAADELFDLALAVTAMEISACGQPGVIGAFAQERLIMVLDGPDGAIGAASVDMQIIAGLIEMQTMGQVTRRAAEPRKPTQTDAALIAPLLNATLSGFAAGLAADLAGDQAKNQASNQAGQAAAGFRFGAMIEGPRLLGLLLDAPDFHLFRLTLDLGGGGKQGELVLALPVCPVSPPEGEAAGGTGQETQLGQGALMAAHAPMAAVLHRLSLPLAELVALKPGERLDIPREALARTRLEDGRGEGIVTCRLGQINGFRAVRLRGAVASLRAALSDDRETDADVGQPGAPAPSEAGEEEVPKRATGARDGAKEAAPLATGGASDGLSEIPASPSARDLPDLPELPELTLDA
ncbi:FliM/FliN family flagellar motor C-terminal domain-containing protein [Aquicoccus sp. G2-2]|uniref:FliM/FliN family flagellar motor C-terminal domain-containing protein n=1 Tax=Aquicoccus sp. G2-2 TaxID=3092120 RepID=UPI002ADFC02B|nr:FliM/FliN family flagellar motor C-terminal domain-containing protein [Aquicoccus sp. G2-2]MEA1113240.1 FliM/FliN family flagellar motor C-terminal domain-containing protein [Aquicoccus sp. G2-2]